VVPARHVGELGAGAALVDHLAHPIPPVLQRLDPQRCGGWWPAGVLETGSVGAYPIHSGCCAVPSNRDPVLNGSNLPVSAASRVFAVNAAISCLLSGLNVRAASNA